MMGGSSFVSPVSTVFRSADANLEALGGRGPAAEYKELLQSFFSGTQKWLAPPPSLSPFLLARAGFECTDTGVIQCPLCREKWTWRKGRVRQVPPSSCSTEKRGEEKNRSSETNGQASSCPERKRCRENGDAEPEKPLRSAFSSRARQADGKARRRGSSDAIQDSTDEDEDSEMIDAVALSFVHSECCPRRGTFISLFDVGLAGAAVMPVTLVQNERSRLEALYDRLVEKARQPFLPLISLRSALGYLSSLILSQAECLSALRKGGFLDLDRSGTLSRTSESAEQMLNSPRVHTAPLDQNAVFASEASTTQHKEHTSLSLLLQLLILLFHPCFANLSVHTVNTNTQAAVLTEIIRSGEAREENEQRKNVQWHQETDSAAISLGTMLGSASAFFPTESCVEKAHKFLRSLSDSKECGKKLSLENILSCVLVDPLKVLALFGWEVGPKSAGRDAGCRSRRGKLCSFKDGGRAMDSEEGASVSTSLKTPRDGEEGKAGAETPTERLQNYAAEHESVVECRYCLRTVELSQFRQYAVQEETRFLRDRQKGWMHVCSEYTQFYCQALEHTAATATLNRRDGESVSGEDERGRGSSVSCDEVTDIVLGTYLPSPRLEGREPGVFDPVLDHRLHCPYISGAVYGGQAVVERVIHALVSLQISGFEQAREREELRKEAAQAWSWRKKLEPRK
ncbi:C3HC zinc finger-like protein [Toxoplasma gondii p89]|uniref:C3HC zinc finger-like protein n=1 Tax=Toxoplasma gondii p89 TaxID=943119 RepID=A0A086JSB5_TOXGO|nr:C3HC zinc finger-like protein [Toxoplasma gondii p89]